MWCGEVWGLVRWWWRSQVLEAILHKCLATFVAFIQWKLCLCRMSFALPFELDFHLTFTHFRTHAPNPSLLCQSMSRLQQCLSWVTLLDVVWWGVWGMVWWWWWRSQVPEATFYKCLATFVAFFECLPSFALLFIVVFPSTFTTDFHTSAVGWVTDWLVTNRDVGLFLSFFLSFIFIPNVVWMNLSYL